MRILVVDDHQLIRAALRNLLSTHPGWSICGEAADGRDAVEKAKRLNPDVILMDVSMPRMNGIEAASILRVELPRSLVVLLSQNTPESLRGQALSVKAAGFVLKDDAALRLIPTLEKISKKNLGSSLDS